MKHPITALSFQHKRFSRLDVLTVLLAELGKVQGSASPEWRMIGQDWKLLWEMRLQIAFVSTAEYLSHIRLLH